MVKIWAKAMENKKIKRAYVFEREGAVRYADFFDSRRRYYHF